LKKTTLEMNTEIKIKLAGEENFETIQKDS